EGAVVGPLADFVRTSRSDAELAERLLGEWLHAVLVRDAAAVDEIRRWHAKEQPGPLLLLPCVPGPRLGADGHPLRDELRVDGPAAAWVHALLAGHEVLDGGLALRRANGAVFLAGRGAGGGPLLRRAELEGLEHEVGESEAARSRAAAELDRALAELAEAEAGYAAAAAAAERARELALEAGAQQGEAAQVEARRAAAGERAARCADEAAVARRQATDLGQEIAALDHDATTLSVQRTQWEDALQDRRHALAALEAATGEAEARVRGAEAELARAEAGVNEIRRSLDALGEEEHRLELERSQVLGRKQALAARVEAEWRKPLDQLLAEAPEVPGDIEWLRQENERLKS